MERQELLTSISETVSDYRQYGDNPIPQIDEDHVDRWIRQFKGFDQTAILRELDHVLKQTYISTHIMDDYFDKLIDSITPPEGQKKGVAWSNIHLLDIQKSGTSQKDLNQLLNDKLREKLEVSTNKDPHTPKSFVYLDDGIFTGNKLIHSLSNWIRNEAPSECDLYILSIISYKQGYKFAKERIEDLIKESGKSIALGQQFHLELENGLDRIKGSISEVLRPSNLTSENSVHRYVSNLPKPPTLRAPGPLNGNSIFSSETGRVLLETAFLAKGCEIYHYMSESWCSVTKNLRPLGFSCVNKLGFGAIHTTFRNCPNNTPLVFWADEYWTPLFPRVINAKSRMNRDEEKPLTSNVL